MSLVDVLVRIIRFRRDKYSDRKSYRSLVFQINKRNHIAYYKRIYYLVFIKQRFGKSILLPFLNTTFIYWQNGRSGPAFLGYESISGQIVPSNEVFNKYLFIFRLLRFRFPILLKRGTLVQPFRGLREYLRLGCTLTGENRQFHVKSKEKRNSNNHLARPVYYSESFNCDIRALAYYHILLFNIKHLYLCYDFCMNWYFQY